jgi:catechol 2,3-dioxygenase-like lactoylglutathione lyase family enzyme
MVPVSDQDEAIRFYTETLGFTLSADVPFGEGDRWVEVSPRGGAAALALVPPRGEYQTGRNTASQSKQAMRAPTTPSSGIRASTSTRNSWGETALFPSCSSFATTTETTC